MIFTRSLLLVAGVLPRNQPIQLFGSGCNRFSRINRAARSSPDDAAHWHRVENWPSLIPRRRAARLYKGTSISIGPSPSNSTRSAFPNASNELTRVLGAPAKSIATPRVKCTKNDGSLLAFGGPLDLSQFASVPFEEGRRSDAPAHLRNRRPPFREKATAQCEK
jgi:hypothetical protein